jgi:hypothetical protein
MRLGGDERSHRSGRRVLAAAAGVAACGLGATAGGAGAAVPDAVTAAALGGRPIVALGRSGPALDGDAAQLAAQAPPPAAVVVRDAVDIAGGLDLTRVQFGRAADGRLRTALTLAAPWRMRDLPADEGPPGSLCLRMWTEPARSPRFPDRLLCITADRRGRHMNGSVFVERGGVLQRAAHATLARSSTRTVVARFTQSAIGRPDSVLFAAEATSPGCARPACVDTAPNAPTVATLTLRSA